MSTDPVTDANDELVREAEVGYEHQITMTEFNNSSSSAGFASWMQRQHKRSRAAFEEIMAQPRTLYSRS